MKPKVNQQIKNKYVLDFKEITNFNLELTNKPVGELWSSVIQYGNMWSVCAGVGPLLGCRSKQVGESKGANLTLEPVTLKLCTRAEMIYFCWQFELQTFSPWCINIIQHD